MQNCKRAINYGKRDLEKRDDYLNKVLERFLTIFTDLQVLLNFFESQFFFDQSISIFDFPLKLKKLSLITDSGKVRRLQLNCTC
jgi:hypothetical protein